MSEEKERKKFIAEVGRKTFIAKGGGYCPHCTSDDIYVEEGGEKEFDPEEDWGVCNNCHGQWLELYDRTLRDVDLDEQDYFWTREHLQNMATSKKRVPKKL